MTSPQGSGPSAPLGGTRRPEPTIFGLPGSLLRRLLDGVTGEDVEEAARQTAGSAPADARAVTSRVLGREARPEEQPALGPAARFARAAFTVIAEPGDRAAGLAVRALGAEQALDCVVRGRQADDIAGLAGDLEDAQDLARLWPKALERWRPRLSMRRVTEALEHARHVGATLLVPGDAAWPAGLADLGDHAPSALWVRGHPRLLTLSGRGVAIVGARAATAYGTHMAAEIASGLVDAGAPVVSGAAYGIDGMAHRAALASQGLTLAFLAGGPDRLYPSGHAALLEQIIREGCVVAEMPCGSSPTRWRFLQRNRLLAAATAATVVVEAGTRSGSLNTAGHAAQLGRPLGAVPGPVTSPASAGCHRLIRDYDAQLIASAADAAELAGIDATQEHPTSEGSASIRFSEGASTKEIRLLDALTERTPRDVRELAELSGLAPSAVQAALGILEVSGAVGRSLSGWVRTRR